MITQLQIAKEVNRKFDQLDANSSREIVDFIFDHMKEQVYKSKKVCIMDFFTMYIDVKKPQNFHNISTGKQDKTPYKWGLIFRWAKSFKLEMKNKPIYIPKEDV